MIKPTLSVIFCNRDVSCPKTLKHHKFLWFKWTTEGFHDYELVSVKSWGGYDWHQWEVTVKCKVCGASTRQFGIEETTLVRYNIQFPYPQ